MFLLIIYKKAYIMKRLNVQPCFYQEFNVNNIFIIGIFYYQYCKTCFFDSY